MPVTPTKQDYAFLQGGGEMGALTRTFTWSKTALGTPDVWSQSLRTTLGILLHSAFPMLLFWGDDLLCFYNDAFRPSLGLNGKHPAVGKAAKEVWPEVWNFIEPLFERVRTTGEPVWIEDQLVPIYRNGQLQDVYWTFSYSPVYGDDEQVGGLLVICTETTEKVKNVKQLQESKHELEQQTSYLQNALDIADLGTYQIDIATNRVTYTDNIRQWVGLEAVYESMEVVLSRVHPDDQPLAAQTLAQIVDQKRHDITCRIVDAAGNTVRHLRSIGKVLVADDQPQTIHGIIQDVTPQILARQALEKSEQNLRNTILKAPVAMCILKGPQYVVEIANERMIEFWGKPADNVLNKPIFEGLHEAKNQGFEQLLDQVFTTGKTVSAQEVPIKLPRQSCIETVYVNFLYEAYHEADGSISGIIAVANEVTTQILARQKVEESEQKLRSLVESAPFPIGVYIGREMRIQLANQTILATWGKGNDVIGKLYAEVLPELATQGILAQLDGVYTTGIPFHAKNQRVDLIVAGKLQPYYFNYSFTPLFDGFGQVYGVMNTAANVTDLALAMQQVEETEIALRGAIELAELATWSLDIGRGTINYSARFMDWLGFSANTKAVDEAYNPLPNDYRQPVADAITAVIRPDSSGLYENEHPIINRLTGQVRIIHAQAQVFYNALGKPVTLSGTAQDVTEQRRRQQELELQVQFRTEELAATNEELAATNEELAATNEELAASNDELAATNNELTESNGLLNRSNQNLQQFAYVASHDLQEPLRKIQSFGDLLKAQYADQLGEGVDHLNRMQAAASRMSVLIKDLLTFSRISTQRESTASVSLSHVIHTAMNDLDLIISETGARVIVASLPVVQGDRSQLGQLFQNLLSNALKFHKPGTIPVIRVYSQQIASSDLPASVRPTRVAAAYHRIDVSDNGIGFDEKYVDRIFQVFQRLHSKSQFAGTGIGLAICEKVATNHGGAITATSQAGQGATFSVYLPVSAG